MDDFEVIIFLIIALHAILAFCAWLRLEKFTALLLTFSFGIFGLITSILLSILDEINGTAEKKREKAKFKRLAKMQK